jgi:hypothetical protein
MTDSKQGMTDHPYPWLAICKHCREVIRYDPTQPQPVAFWTFRDAFGAHTSCMKAPKRSYRNLPGLHVPTNALSSRSKELGPVPEELWPTFEDYE